MSIHFSGSVVYPAGPWGSSLPAADLEVCIQIKVTKTRSRQPSFENPAFFETYDEWETLASGRTDSDGRFQLGFDGIKVGTDIRGVLRRDGEEVNLPSPLQAISTILAKLASGLPFDIQFPQFTPDWKPPMCKPHIKGSVVTLSSGGSSPVAGARVDVYYAASRIGWGDTIADGTFEFDAQNDCPKIGMVLPTVTKDQKTQPIPASTPIVDGRVNFLPLVFSPGLPGFAVNLAPTACLVVKGKLLYPSLPWREPAPLNTATVELYQLINQRRIGVKNSAADGSFEFKIEDFLPEGSVFVKVIDGENRFTFPPAPAWLVDPASLGGRLSITVDMKNLVVPWPSNNPWSLLAAGLPVHVSMTGAGGGPIEANANATLGGALKADLTASGAATLAGDDNHPLRMDLTLSRLPKATFRLAGFDIGFYLFSWKIFSIKMKGVAQLDDSVNQP